jgi:histidine triad (HIT) family protein
MKNCLFCAISAKTIPSEIIYEDNSVIVFKDLYPKKPIHWLVVPRKHIASINKLETEDIELIGQLILVIKKLAVKHGFADNGYRIVINTNAHGGQEIDHLHIHILAGAHVGPMVTG